MICPTCGELLGDKQLVYEKELKDLCEKLGVDYNYLSETNNSSMHPEFVEGRKKIVNKLCERYCCKMLMMTYINKVEYVE
jgi:DNA-directed RNA polymerase subunit N (RpoN/RPB10)